MAFQLIAQTDVKQHLFDSYQLLIYQDTTGEVESVQTLELVSDFKLIRGNASAKDRINYFLNTKIDFTLKDSGRFLTKKLLDYPETDFKAIIKKNSSNWFTGYITGYLNKYDFTDIDAYADFTIYDGLNRLKEIKTISSLPTGLIKFSDLIRTIFNELRFDLNIHSYLNANAGFDLVTGINKPLWLSYIKVSDIVATMGADISYYDILEFIAKLFNYSIFQESNVWVLRSNIYMYNPSIPSVDGIKREIIVYSSGASTVSRVTLTASILKSDLAQKSLKLQYGKIDKTIFRTKVFKPNEVPNMLDRLELLEWTNPYFRMGSQGWTIQAGDPKFLSNSVIMQNGESIYQESINIEEETEFLVKVQAHCTRMILNDGDRVLQWYENPLCRIVFVGNNEVDYYLNTDTLDWEIDLRPDSLFGIELLGSKDPETGSYLREYTRKTFNLDIELMPPPGSDGGKVKIILYGGAVASGNDFPGEFSAIHSHCYVEKKIIEDVTNIIAPKQIEVSAAINNPKETIEIDIPYNDYLPYIGVSLWNLQIDEFGGESFHRSDNWLPDGDLLLKIISKKIVEFNRNNRGYDLRILPGKSISFLNLFEADLENESQNSYYLTLYEESLLIDDKKRFLVIEHEESSESVSNTLEFHFDDTTD